MVKPQLQALGAWTCTADARSASATLDVTECAAWKAGYDAMGGANWTYCNDKRQDPCGCDADPVGVRVRCADGHITAIDLGLSPPGPKANLVGTLPAEWSALAWLEEINLSYSRSLTGLCPQSKKHGARS